MQAGVGPEGGAVDRDAVIGLLNIALATELVCVLRYQRHQVTARGLGAPGIAEEFRRHAREEEEHAERFARRIIELQGQPNVNPPGLASRGYGAHGEDADLATLVREDHAAERVAVETYAEMIRHIGGEDPASRRLLEEVRVREQEHARELAALAERLRARDGDGPRAG
jgi:bacterioferritin